MSRRRVSVAIVVVLLLLVVPALAQFDGEKYHKRLPVVVKQGEGPTNTPTTTIIPSVTSTRTPSPTATHVPVTLLPNGGFEQGATVWQPTSGLDELIIQNPPAPIVPHSGSWLAQTPARGQVAALDAIDVLIPAGTPYLSYWIWIRSEEATCGEDEGGVGVFPQGGPSEAVDEFDLCAATQTDGWVKHTVNLSAYAGETVTIEFLAATFDHSEINSVVYWDDIGFQPTP